MKQMSTGFGLAVLGACVLGAAIIASPRFGQQAFAQVTGERRIVSASVYTSGSNQIAYRIWSDNQIELKNLGFLYNPYGGTPDAQFYSQFTQPTQGNFLGWRTVDNGRTSFIPADVDANGSVDSSDLGNVLVNYGETQDGNPPPPIDCTINAPR